MLLTVGVSNAQDADVPMAIKNEVSVNLLDLVAAGTLDVGYERFLGGNQSLSLDVSFFDTFGYYDVGYIDKSTGVSARLAYNLYFSKRKEYGGFYFYPMVKYRTGKVSTSEDYYDVQYVGNDVISEQYDFKQKYSIEGFAAGFGVGNKWVLKDKFTLDITANLSRTLGSFDSYYIDSVEFRAGVSFAYRF
ncbi:hypothetical protein Y10_31480 [Neptunitalea sp. Y10]|uniref:Outer membrane protein beta-barrel domain-containing protein n=2 Tax=Neptunitalea lumnitzerae TaxID=2965509 RepID=A0ABQ5MNV8_9FLAO|nr:hypothetical protein Y10_31480 [Neptunitalea sp. Y10]